MSSRNKKIIGVIVAVVVLLLLGLVIWLSTQTSPSDITIVNNEPAGTSGNGSFNANFGTAVQRPVLEATGPVEPEPDPERPDPRANLRRLAASFAERYGSFSNQGDFENLKELKVFMTDSMAREVDAYIAQAGAGGPSPEYLGMITKALSSTISMFDEGGGTATVVVNTQRQETTGAGTRVFYQEIQLEFIRSGEVWEVDSAEWLED